MTERTNTTKTMQAIAERMADAIATGHVEAGASESEANGDRDGCDVCGKPDSAVAWLGPDVHACAECAGR